MSRKTVINNVDNRTKCHALTFGKMESLPGSAGTINHRDGADQKADLTT
jgi:hypothetical protein